ncbi:ring finger [Fusarium napiforme]|uniref:Ring finger n=1 Tax=Fusarium napiforme TaxID=42672 RepID=A0A8H5JX45_9HYPO|nr:ring finger [Fusarium napiforme]
MPVNRGTQRAGRGRPASGRPQCGQARKACDRCLRGLQSRLDPGKFLRSHGYPICHMNAPQSEEQRYSFIEAHLKAMVAKSVDNQGFYQACYDLLKTAEIPAASLSEEVRNTIMENHKQLHDTAWPKLLYILETDRTCRYFDPRDVLSMLIYNYPRELAKQVQVMMGDHFETFRVIQYAFMRCGRWFLGYSPGTFIFRYSNSLPFTEGLNVMPSVMNFTYEGQVPRSSSEHKLRLMALWKPASELFIGLMHHHLGRSHKTDLPRHEALRSREVICSDAFRIILEDWRWLSQRGTFPYQNTKNWICKHAMTQELAWLILRLKDVPEVYGDVQSPDLENLLTTSTGLSLQVLAGLWNQQLETMAWEHFHSGNRRELFIYEHQGSSSELEAPTSYDKPLKSGLKLDAVKNLPEPNQANNFLVQNIWRLYNEQTFKYDIFNPSVEYNLPVLRDCRDALKPYDHLIQEKLRQAREQASQCTQVGAQQSVEPFSFSTQN